MNLKSDEELVLLYNEGQDLAFDELYKRYKNVILSYAHSVYCVGADIEDVIQEGMLGLLKAVKSYNKKASFKNYAFICIKTNIVKAVSRYFSNKNLPLNSSISISDCENEINVVSDNLEDNIIFKEKLENLLEKAKENLSPFELKVLNLFLKGYSYIEISEQLNCLPKKCDNALQRIKKKLAEEE